MNLKESRLGVCPGYPGLTVDKCFVFSFAKVTVVSSYKAVRGFSCCFLDLLKLKALGRVKRLVVLTLHVFLM